MTIIVWLNDLVMYICVTISIIQCQVFWYRNFAALSYIIFKLSKLFVCQFEFCNHSFETGDLCFGIWQSLELFQTICTCMIKHHHYYYYILGTHSELISLSLSTNDHTNKYDCCVAFGGYIFCVQDHLGCNLSL